MNDKNNNIPLDKSNGYGDLKLNDLKSLGKERGIAPPKNQRSKEAWTEALQKDDVKKEGERGNDLSDVQDKSDTKDTPQNTKNENENQQKPADKDAPKNSEQDLAKEAERIAESAAVYESVFDDVINKLEQRFDIDSLSLKFNGEEALTYQNGDVKDNFLNESQSNLLQSALRDPQNFEGSVTIKSGNRTILKIENGQVTRDSMGLVRHVLA